MTVDDAWYKVSPEEAERRFRAFQQAAEARMQARAEAAGPVVCEPCKAGGPLRACIRPCTRPADLSGRT